MCESTTYLKNNLDRLISALIKKILRTRLKTKFSTSVKAIFRKYFEVSEFNITLLPSSQIFKLVRTTQTKVWTMILSTLSSYFLHFIPPWLENLFIYNNNNSKKNTYEVRLDLDRFANLSKLAES